MAEYKNYKNNEELEGLYGQDELDLNKVTSTTELTGLMPTPAATDAEIASYNDIYALPKKKSDTNQELKDVTHSKHLERPLNKVGNVDPYDVALRQNDML